MEEGNDPRAGTELAPEARSITSASNLFRRKLCPGSALAEHGLPDLASSSAADFGTEMHQLEADEVDPSSIGVSFKRIAIERNADVTERFIRGIIEEGESFNLLREHDLTVRDENGAIVHTVINGEYHPLTGTADEMRYYPSVRKLFVFDSKFGRWPVTSADLNMQLALYGLAGFDYYHQMADEIYVAIRQPYLPEPLNFHSAVYKKEQMPMVRKMIIGIIRRSEKLDAPRVASIEACRFCRARGTARCPESMALVTELAQNKITALKPAELESLAPAIMAAKSIVEAWAERMKFIANNYPALLKDHELASTGEMRSINASEAYTALFNDGALGDRLSEVFFNACTLSLTRLVEGAKEVFPNDSMADIKVLGPIDHLIVRKPKAQKLVKKRKP